MHEPKLRDPLDEAFQLLHRSEYWLHDPKYYDKEP